MTTPREEGKKTRPQDWSEILRGASSSDRSVRIRLL